MNDQFLLLVLWAVGLALVAPATWWVGARMVNMVFPVRGERRGTRSGRHGG